MKVTAVKLLWLFSVCGFLCFQPGQSRAVYQDDLDGLEDTFVPLGDEKPAAHSIYRRAALLEEVMGPLSRNVRAIDEQTRSEMVYRRMAVLLSLLRMRIGATPRVEIMHFQNWDKTIEIDQLFYIRVKSVFEVRRVILAARGLGMRVRATGVGHSRSPLYVDEGNIMLDVRDLERHDGPRMEFHDTVTPKRITAMTGVIQRDLNAFMTLHKVTVLAEPLNDVESFGGMVAAGTHGSAWNGTTISGVVVEMRVMDAYGRLRRFTKEKHPDIMKAASMNLGMFGIMYDITIEVADTFVVKVENRFVTLGKLMLDREELKREVTSSFQTEFSWYPFNAVRGAAAEEYNRTKVVPASWTAADDEVWLRTINIASRDEYTDDEILGPTYLPTKGSLSGGSIKSLLRGQGAIAIIKKLPARTFHYLANAFPLILPPRFGTETSAAFMLNVDEDFDRVARAMKFLVERTEQQIKARGTQPFNALLPRFFKGHDCYLCTGNDNIKQADDSGRTMVVDVLAPPAQDGFYPISADFVKAFKTEKIRPHWAKRHDNIVGIIDQIKDVYGDLLPKFTEQRRLAKIDPCDMFMNSYLLSIFERSDSCY